MNNNKVSISAGNTKMGAIPSVSLSPIVTCPAGCPCAKLCYAAKICRLRPNVKAAYQRNLDILQGDPESYWTQVKAAAIVSRYFRYHVSGDIPSAEYFNKMVQLARDLPGTNFLAFTKKYSIVNAYIADRGAMPENLKIIFSAWGAGWTVPNPHDLPVAEVIFKGNQPAPDWKICGGNCTECACRGIGCWELKNGETIAFYEH